MFRYVIFFSLVIFFGTLFFPVHINAQINAGFFTNINPEISFDPTFPGPNEEVTVNLSAHSFNQFGATMRWFVDGTEVPEARDQTSLTLTTGIIGESKRIQAFVSGSDISATVEKTLTVRDVDIILEADTIVPAFYEGRALPSAGNEITAVAIPQLGSAVDTQSLFYAWSVNNKILFGGPQQGMSRAVIPPDRNPERTLSVTVSSEAGEPLVKKAVPLSAVNPTVRFYIDNPLRGIRERAVEHAVVTPNDEITLRAVPFYMGEDVTDNTNAKYQWNINRREVVNPGDDPFSITLQRNAADTAVLGFLVQNLDNFLQRSARQISVIFE